MKDDFYQQYLEHHKNPKCKLMHLIGQFMTLFFILYVIFSGKWLMILLTPLIIYPFAVSGHILFGEKGNKPAFFKMSFAKAKLADLMMCRDILLGKHKIW